MKLYLKFLNISGLTNLVLSSVVSHLSLLKGLVPRRCQHAKNVMLADRSGLMDVRIALVNSLLNLLKGQVDFCGGIQITD